MSETGTKSIMEVIKPLAEKHIDEAFNDAFKISIGIVRSHMNIGKSDVNKTLEEIIKILQDCIK